MIRQHFFTEDSMTEKEIVEAKKEIDKMSQYELCRLWRFLPASSNGLFSNIEVAEYLKKKLEEKGGFTPEISKQLGW
jgi:hypothetical protein